MTELDIPERLSYRGKKSLLGHPLVTANLREENLTKKSGARGVVE